MPEHRAVLVTGCAGGVGSALSRAFSEAGYVVIGTDLQRPREAAPDYFLSADLEALVLDSEALKRFERDVLQLLVDADAELACLVNNAALQVTGSLTEVSIADFERSQRVNVTASLALVKTFAERLAGANGAVVNIGSIHARLSKAGFGAYAVSKSALSGLTRSLALDLGGRVTVNAILPAALDTAMLRDGFRHDPDKLAEVGGFHPAGRIGSPQEVAKIAVFLCSPDARFITGVEIGVDGGIGVRLHDPA